MGKFTVNTKQMQADVQSVRPIKYEDSGLMSKIWVIDGVMYSYYKNVLLWKPVEGVEDFQVDAESFRKAVNAAKSEEIVFNITAAGNLTITAGRLKTRMQLLNEPIPDHHKINNWYSTHGQLLPTLIALAKWVPDQAPKAWATTLLLRNGYAFASDGKYMIRERLNVDFEFECAITKPMLQTLVKLKSEPTSIAYFRDKLYFGFEDGLSIDAPTLADKWPDINNFFTIEHKEFEYTKELNETLEQLTGYDEGQAILEILDESNARSSLPDKLIPKMTVDIKFESTKFPLPFNVSISHMSKLSKGMTNIGIGSRTLKMWNEARTVILSLMRD